MIIIGIVVAVACLYLLWQWWTRDLAGPDRPLSDTRDEWNTKRTGR